MTTAVLFLIDTYDNMCYDRFMRLAKILLVPILIILYCDRKYLHGRGIPYLNAKGIMATYALAVLAFEIYSGQQLRAGQSVGTLTKSVEHDTYLKNYCDTKRQLDSARLMQSDSTKIDQLETELRVLAKKLADPTCCSCDVMPAEYEKPLSGGVINLFNRVTNITRLTYLRVTNFTWQKHLQAISIISHTNDLQEEISSIKKDTIEIKKDHSGLKEKLDDLQSTIESLNSSIMKIVDYL